MLRIALVVLAANIFLAQNAAAEVVICHENCNLYVPSKLLKRKHTESRQVLAQRGFIIVDENFGFYLSRHKRHGHNMRIIERQSIAATYQGSSSDDDIVTSFRRYIWEGQMGNSPRCIAAGPGTQTRLEQVTYGQPPCQAPAPAIIPVPQQACPVQQVMGQQQVCGQQQVSNQQQVNNQQQVYGQQQIIDDKQQIIDDK